MSRSIFISYDYNDRAWRDNLSKWQSQGQLGTGLKMTFERDDLRQGGDSAIKNEINAMIQGCDTVLVIVGNNTHNRPWIDYEVSVANARHKKVLVGRIPNTTGAAPRELRGKQEVLLDPSSLKYQL